MPSMGFAGFDYAALLYSGESPANPPSTNFVQGTATENAGETKLNFSFQRPEETSGLTLEIFAFKAGTSAANFSKENAPLSGSKTGLSIVGDTIEINGTIALSVNSSSKVKGTVSLKIKLPEGCSLEIDDTTSDGESRFNVAGTSPDFTVTQAGDGISAGAYQVTFTVKKESEIVHIFSEYINVFPGMCTDTWNGLGKDDAKEISQSMISSTVYVRGEGGWYDTTSPYNDGKTAEADDTNSGSFLSPLASIQKAIDKIIAINDGASEYTIYVDGTLTATSSTALADFNGVSQALSVRIVSLSASNKSVLNGNGTARCVTMGGAGKRDLNLTLENLVITNGIATGNGGGIFFNAKTLEMTGCEVIGCKATSNGGGVYIYSGAFTMSGGSITSNTATSNGGGVCVYSGTFTMKGGTIGGDNAEDGNTAFYGGGVYVDSGAFTMSGGSITSNTATSNGGGVYIYSGTFKMNGSTISGCTATFCGGGVYIASGGTFEMSGTAKISGCKETSTSSSSGGGGIYNAGTLIISGGTISDCVAAINGGGIYNNVSDASIVSTITNCEISGCKATGTATYYGFGGGIYNASSTLELTDVTIAGENDSDNPDARLGGGIYNKGSLTITGGKISNCTSILGGGVYNDLGTLKITGGTISNCISESSGGGIVVSGNGTNTTCSSEIINCTIESCVSNSTSTGTSGGGGIYCHQQNLTITGGKISGCKSEGQGGGMSIMAYNFPLKIEDVTITDCNAKNGGGCYVAALVDESVNQEIIKNCIIKSCTATEKGGGISIGGGTTGGKYYAVTVSGSEISECESPSGSGVFLPLGTSLWLKDSTLKNDVSTSTGTASIYLAGSTTVTEGVIDFSAFTATTKPKLYVQDALSQDSVATIKLGSTYQIGDTILQAAEGYTLAEEDCKRFAIDGGAYGIALMDGEGKLVAGGIYLDSSSGSDANSGLTASNAVKTLSKAIELFDSQYAQKIMVCAAYTLPSSESDLLDRIGGG